MLRPLPNFPRPHPLRARVSPLAKRLRADVEDILARSRPQAAALQAITAHMREQLNTRDRKRA